MNPLPARPPPSCWMEYWDQDDFWRDSELWKINARLFSDVPGRWLDFAGMIRC
jgi:hypothetical protein